VRRYVVGSPARHIMVKSKWTNVIKMKCNEGEKENRKHQSSRSNRILYLDA